VSRVLGGSWTRDPDIEQSCGYINAAAGAGFSTSLNDQAFGPNLRVARGGCLPVVKPIVLRRGGYVCIERAESGDFIVGDFNSGGRRWLLVMPQASERPHRPELSATTALVGAAPK
jgi:hypothetical protein